MNASRLFGLDVGNSRVRARELTAAAREPDAAACARLLGAAPELALLRDAEAALDALTAAAAGPVAILMSCVDPELGAALAAAAGARGLPLRAVRAPDVPLRHPYPDPLRLGPDRIVAAHGARELVGAPVVVVDAGTAVTVDLVDREGAFAGGAIAAGRAVLARALGRSGRMLTEVETDGTLRYPGRDREAALAAGVVAGVRGAIVSLVGAARALEPDAPVLACGGDVALAVDALAGVGIAARREDALVFLGLARLADGGR